MASKDSNRFEQAANETKTSEQFEKLKAIESKF